MSHWADEAAPLGSVGVRLDVINALDHTYEIRDGVGVGALRPSLGVFAGITKEF